MDKNEFFEALKLIKQEKNVDITELIEKVKTAMLTVAKKEYNGIENVYIDVDEKNEKFEINIGKKVVPKVEDSVNEILLEEARHYNKNANYGDIIRIKLDTKKVGRIAVQSAKQVIKQGIKAAERNNIYLNLKRKEGMILAVKVHKTDEQKNGFVTVGIDGYEAVLPKSEQIPGQVLSEGDIIKVHIFKVVNTEKGPKAMISRVNSEFIKKMFELEIPEVADNTVKVMAIAREAGFRTKVAVISTNKNVDPVGTCIGSRGMRISKILNEIADEKIDIIQYSENAAEFIKSALLPAEAEEVDISDEENKTCFVFVPEEQISLAIGHKGQNARLVAKLTGFKIDIRTKNQHSLTL